MNDVFKNKSINIWNHSYHNFNTVSDKDSVHNTVFSDDGKSETTKVFAAVSSVKSTGLTQFS